MAVIDWSLSKARIVRGRGLRCSGAMWKSGALSLEVILRWYDCEGRYSVARRVDVCAGSVSTCLIFFVTASWDRANCWFGESVEHHMVSSRGARQGWPRI